MELIRISENCRWSAEQDKLGPAFELFLEHVRDPSKDASNPHFRSKFVSLGAAIEAIRPASHSFGIYIRQPIEGMGIATIIDHPASGQFRWTWAPLMLEKQTPQGMGSAITYLRRYSLLSALGLEGDVDDDAEAAEAPHRPSKAPEPQDDPIPTQPDSTAETSLVDGFSRRLGEASNLDELKQVWTQVQAAPLNHDQKQMLKTILDMSKDRVG